MAELPEALEDMDNRLEGCERLYAEIREIPASVLTIPNVETMTGGQDEIGKMGP